MPTAIFLLSFSILFLGALSPSAGAREIKARAVALNLKEALSIGLRDNRDIILDQEKLEQAKIKVKESQGAFFPEITLGGATTNTRELYNEDIVSHSFSASLKQYIYRGGKNVSALKEARYRKEFQEALLNKTRLNISSRIKKAFYTILITEEFVRLNLKVMDNKKAHYDYFKDRHSKGESHKQELSDAEYDLLRARSLYEASQNQLIDSYEAFKNTLYLDEGINVVLEGALEYIPKALAVDEAILKALALRPDIRQYEARARADKASIEKVKSGARPEIYASFDYFSRSTSYLSFSPGRGWQDYHTMGVALRWPIFDGWVTKAKVEEAISTLKQDHILQDKLKVDLTLEVKEAYLSLKTAITKQKPTAKDIELSRERLNTARARYAKGLLSNLDLDDAKLSLSLADFNQKESLYDCLTAKADLDKAMGVN